MNWWHESVCLDDDDDDDDDDERHHKWGVRGIFPKVLPNQIKSDYIDFLGYFQTDRQAEFDDRESARSLVFDYHFLAHLIIMINNIITQLYAVYVLVSK